jgi:hypothetical protein
VHSTTGFSAFKIIYGFNPLTTTDLIPLPFEEWVSLDNERKKNGETTPLESSTANREKEQNVRF